MFDFEAPLFWYKLVFTGEIILAEILATYTLKKKKYFIWRVLISITVAFSAAFLFPILSFNAIYSSFMFLCLFGVTVLLLRFCYDESWINLFFCGIIAYTTQHIAFQIYNFFTTVTGIESINVYSSERNADFSALANVAYFGIYALVYWLIWAFVEHRIRQQEDLRISNIALLVLSGVVVLADIVFNAIIVYDMDEFTSRLIISIFYLSNILSCALALGMQFYMLSNKLVKKELKTVQMLWHQDKVNYELSKENIEIINIKCHDLKHQISQLRNSNGEVDKEALKEIEDAVNIYGSIVKTGNDVLDVIIAEKSLFCDKNNISLTCLVDGAQLNFISPADIYSLFGNAIQNAIEAVSKVQQKNKRIIRLNVARIEKFISIHVENYFSIEDSMQFKNGLPVTTKEDKAFHGFGMRSMQLLSEKLGGGLKVSTNGELFSLDILLPADTNSINNNS